MCQPKGIHGKNANHYEVAHSAHQEEAIDGPWGLLDVEVNDGVIQELRRVQA